MGRGALTGRSRFSYAEVGERRSTMTREVRGKLGLLVISTALAVLVFEGAVRFCIKPSPSSYGTLLGRELPPLRVIPARTTVPAATASANDRDPQAIAWADLQGPIREDPILGYAPLERATSPHGWWIANNIGARSTTDTSEFVKESRCARRRPCFA
jgi:hypothetical protein